MEEETSSSWTMRIVGTKKGAQKYGMVIWAGLTLTLSDIESLPMSFQFLGQLTSCGQASEPGVAR